MSKQHSVLSQLIQMRCIDSVPTIDFESFHSQIIREDQDDVGFIF